MGVSASVLRLATIASDRSPPSTALISSTLRGWPTLSGISMSGKRDRVAERQHPDLVGQLRARAHRHVASLALRGADLDHVPSSSSVIRTVRASTKARASGSSTRSMPSS